MLWTVTLIDRALGHHMFGLFREAVLNVAQNATQRFWHRNDPINADWEPKSLPTPVNEVFINSRIEDDDGCNYHEGREAWHRKHCAEFVG